jgi:hypothetical protein
MVSAKAMYGRTFSDVKKSRDFLVNDGWTDAKYVSALLRFSQFLLSITITDISTIPKAIPLVNFFFKQHLLGYRTI